MANSQLHNLKKKKQVVTLLHAMYMKAATESCRELFECRLIPNVFIEGLKETTEIINLIAQA
jgi:hypothetical protein